MKQNMQNLSQFIESNEYYDTSTAVIDTNKYRFDYPDPTNYRIGIIIDPCRNLSYNCCMNVFGTPVYQGNVYTLFDFKELFHIGVIYL